MTLSLIASMRRCVNRTMCRVSRNSSNFRRRSSCHRVCLTMSRWKFSCHESQFQLYQIQLNPLSQNLRASSRELDLNHDRIRTPSQDLPLQNLSHHPLPSRNQFNSPNPSQCPFPSHQRISLTNSATVTSEQLPRSPRCSTWSSRAGFQPA